VLRLFIENYEVNIMIIKILII